MPVNKESSEEQPPKRPKVGSTLRIGTRKSDLALWQAHHVQKLLRDRYSGHHEFEVVGMSTLGDDDQSKPLSAFAAKGVFTKELDIALLTDRVDIAVHSMKDLPTTLPEGLVLVAVLERGDTEDAVVMHAKHKDARIENLPKGSIVGTSALRRRAILAKHFPHVTCKDIRGNVNTRLAKLDRGDYDAIILARTGLKRLGAQFEARITHLLSATDLGYAVGQGALAVVCREGDLDTAKLLAPLVHVPTFLACAAERSLLKELEGGCKVPIAVSTRCSDAKSSRQIDIRGMVMSVDGKKYAEAKESIELSDDNDKAEQQASKAGLDLAAALRKQGAQEILDEIKHLTSQPGHTAPTSDRASLIISPS
jgi:hydroxymethylbilane synthase